MMLPYLLLLLAAANASAYSLQTSGYRRTQLLESYLNGPVPEPQPVVVPLSPHRRSLLQANVTSAQSLAAQDSPVQPKRAFKMAFYNKLDDSRSKSDQDYIMKELIPATAALLARSIRVREPLGLLPLAGLKDEAGLTIPKPPKTSAGAAAPAGYDADIVMKVTSMPADSPECEGLLAGAAAHLVDNASRRPVFGYVTFCNVAPFNFTIDLATAVHEILHALVMDPALFKSYPGYASLSDVVRTFEDGRSIIKTPQVLREVKAHLGCERLLGAELEDDGKLGTRGTHWEQRVFEGELMDSIAAWGDAHHARHVLTDLTLALMQDSGWYDVKYGSGGFNSFGYKAGCAFALGTYAEAMASPNAAQYLCPEEMDRRYMCLHDHSGDGVCHSSANWDGFYRALPSTEDSVDCQGLQDELGMRCLKRKADRWPECVPMSCSDAGKVIIDGKPCNPETTECPPETAMCDDPGHLLCGGALNYCSNRGDCFRGNCYCHIGWGGADCSVSVCTGECPNGSACPPSGFCGVLDCGAWSSGADDRGIACFSALDSTVPHTMTPALETPQDPGPLIIVAPVDVTLPGAAPAPALAPVRAPAPAPAPTPVPTPAPSRTPLLPAAAPLAPPPAPADTAATDEANTAAVPAPQEAMTRGFDMGDGSQAADSEAEETEEEQGAGGPPAAGTEDEVVMDEPPVDEEETPGTYSGSDVSDASGAMDTAAETDAATADAGAVAADTNAAGQVLRPAVALVLSAAAAIWL